MVYYQRVQPYRVCFERTFPDPDPVVYNLADNNLSGPVSRSGAKIFFLKLTLCHVAPLSVDKKFSDLILAPDRFRINCNLLRVIRTV